MKKFQVSSKYVIRAVTWRGSSWIWSAAACRSWRISWPLCFRQRWPSWGWPSRWRWTPLASACNNHSPLRGSCYCSSRPNRLTSRLPASAHFTPSILANTHKSVTNLPSSSWYRSITQHSHQITTTHDII